MSFSFRSVLTLIAGLLFCSQIAGAQSYTYDYNARCAKAYDHYLSLELDKGTELIKQEIRSNPYNLMATYLADYEDCLQLLFNGDKKILDQVRDHQDARISILEKGNSNSPWYRLTKAGVYLHWAFIHVRFGENYKAALAFRKSFLLLKENQKRFPSFRQDDIFFGIEEAMIGTLPDDYKWIASLFGLKGDVKRGINKIDQFINTHTTQDLLYREAVLFSIYLKFYLLSAQQEVWSFINSSKFPVENNLLHLAVKSNIAVSYRKGSIAIQTLKRAQLEPDYSKFPILDFEYASALLLKLDPQSIVYFQKFLSGFRGKFFVKDALQKIAYMYYLQGNKEMASVTKARIKNSGATQVDSDKQAQRFAESADWPNIILLQARLLTDGGYYNEALEKLQSALNFSALPDKLEYAFRLGRIYDELEKDDLAIKYYQNTIDLGRNRKEHFAARAALQMALIYEKQGKVPEALARYSECLSMREHDFQNSIDQQAKAGLNRLGAK